MSDSAISSTSSVLTWTSEQSVEWCSRMHLSRTVSTCVQHEDLDGKCLLALTEADIRDLRDKYNYDLRISDIKRFLLAVRSLQHENASELAELGLDAVSFAPSAITLCPSATHASSANVHNPSSHLSHHGSGSALFHHQSISCESGHNLSQHPHHHQQHHDYDRVSPPLSVDGRATSIQPEFFKTTISLGE